MAKYLKQRGKHGIWYFQRDIPPELKGKVDSALFRDKSLETIDEDIAVKAARKYIVATDDAIDRARALAKAPDYVSDLTPTERFNLEGAAGVEILRDETVCDVKQYRFLDVGAAMSAIVPEDCSSIASPLTSSASKAGRTPPSLPNCPRSSVRRPARCTSLASWSRRSRALTL